MRRADQYILKALFDDVCLAWAVLLVLRRIVQVMPKMLGTDETTVVAGIGNSELDSAYGRLIS